MLSSPVLLLVLLLVLPLACNPDALHRLRARDHTRTAGGEWRRRRDAVLARGGAPLRG